ncbi:MAG: hypothetical protein HC850_18450 [Rhodomicrobium sp.]|nr:hypothetical protein [Rhodomicrobium sp.]
MKVLGMRFCTVAKTDAAAGLAAMLSKLGVAERKMAPMGGSGFQGAVFPIEHNQENSWIEICRRRAHARNDDAANHCR